MVFPGAKKIVRAKVLGVRTEENTKVLATYNTTVYCVLLLYSDNSVELVECNTKEMQKYIQYIEI